MNVIETNLSFGSLSTRSKTTGIYLHHAAATTCDAATIHAWHKAKGWSGIGYHFVVRKDGTIERGRAIDKIGAHVTGYNSYSVGICFEGNFENEEMSAAQKAAGIELVAYVKEKYGIATSAIKRHKDVASTACPGTNFPFADIVGGNTMTETVTTTSTATTTTTSLSKDEWVGRLQAECNEQGYSNQKVDEIAGPDTLAGCPTLRSGESGNITGLMQERLVAMGYDLPEHGIDDDFGSETKAAVKELQTEHEITVDGVVGSDTWSVLLGLS
ncbi:MAG: peptidoglycan-binding domain-containing protein [Eubacteriales bacterium]